MINLLRMDLYRLKRSKSVYICLGILMAITVLAFSMIYLLATPQGRNYALKIGLLDNSETEEAQAIVNGADSLDMFRETCMGIIITLFMCGDFQNGFIKNIMSLHRTRWKYIGSKLAAAGILNFFFLIVCFLFNSLMNLLFHNMVSYAALADTLFYLALAWFINTAFSALVILTCILTRSTAAGVMTSLLLCGGIIQSFLGQITSLFHMDGWLKYTLYYNMSAAPSAYSGIGDLKGAVVGLVFMVFYAATAAFFITRQDI